MCSIDNRKSLTKSIWIYFIAIKPLAYFFIQSFFIYFCYNRYWLSRKVKVNRKNKAIDSNEPNVRKKSSFSYFMNSLEIAEVTAIFANCWSRKYCVCANFIYIKSFVRIMLFISFQFNSLFFWFGRRRKSELCIVFVWPRLFSFIESIVTANWFNLIIKISCVCWVRYVVTPQKFGCLLSFFSLCLRFYSFYYIFLFRFHSLPTFFFLLLLVFSLLCVFFCFFSLLLVSMLHFMFIVLLLWFQVCQHDCGRGTHFGWRETKRIRLNFATDLTMSAELQKKKIKQKKRIPKK